MPEIKINKNYLVAKSLLVAMLMLVGWTFVFLVGITVPLMLVLAAYMMCVTVLYVINVFNIFNNFPMLAKILACLLWATIGVVTFLYSVFGMTVVNPSVAMCLNNTEPFNVFCGNLNELVAMAAIMTGVMMMASFFLIVVCANYDVFHAEHLGIIEALLACVVIIALLPPMTPIALLGIVASACGIGSLLAYLIEKSRREQ